MTTYSFLRVATILLYRDFGQRSKSSRGDNSASPPINLNVMELTYKLLYILLYTATLLNNYKLSVYYLTNLIVGGMHVHIAALKRYTKPFLCCKIGY